MANWKLFYDEGCNLCHSSQHKFEKWAIAAGQPLDIDILQSAEAQQKGYNFTGMVLEADGEVFVGARAILQIAKVGPWFVRWLYPMHRIPPIVWAISAGYWVVARTRYLLFGRRSCPLPGANPNK